MKCKVFDKKASKKYCEVHKKAYLNVIQKFEDWKRATGVSWKEYLKELFENAYTGSWAKEIALSLLSEIE